MASRRDCVIVPGLGAVLATWRSSSYDADSETLLPPSRVFSFNPELRSSDGMLSASVARAEGVTFETAVRMVKDDVEAMWLQLRTYGDVPLGKLGVLHFHAGDNTVTFTPFPSDRLSPASVWLRPIPVREVLSAARARDNAPAAPVRFSPFRRAVRIAASVAVLLGLGLVVSTPVDVPDDVAYASFAPEIEQVAPGNLVPQISVPEACPITMVKSHDADLWIDVQEQQNSVTESVTAFPLDGDYCVVVSSHASLSEAERFIASHSAREMRVLEKDGRYRVYAATGATSSEAARACSALAPEFPSAWVCRR